jgi:hypothetical protein
MKAVVLAVDGWESAKTTETLYFFFPHELQNDDISHTIDII